MKRSLFTMWFCLFALVGLAQTNGDYVEVLYFHGKQRCATCMAIERLAREVVIKEFAAQMKKNAVRFKVVEISTDEGAKLAKAYKVSWSSLYVNGWRNGREKRNDLTRFGFQNARNHPDEFKKEVKAKIEELLE